MSNYVENLDLDKLFEELVPTSGKAATVAGEIVRAVTRIGYRWNNDGDMIGCGYGRETCNPAARYLLANGDARIEVVIALLWRYGEWEEEDLYAEALRELCAAAVDLIEHGSVDLRAIPNTEDMFDYATDEDEDYDEEDEDDYWDDEDEEEEW